jgi:hypothetical protein
MKANEAAQEKTHSVISMPALRGEIIRGANIDRKLMFFAPFPWGLRRDKRAAAITCEIIAFTNHVRFANF